MKNSRPIETIGIIQNTEKVLDNAHFTIGEISVLVSFGAMLISFLWLAAKVGASASEIKNNFVLMDVKLSNDLVNLSNKVDGISARTDTGFGHVKAELAKQSLRISINASKLRDVENYLIKDGYVLRQYSIDDSV